jgi:RNA polymerase sigma factor for flagellar operon FliA
MTEDPGRGATYMTTDTAVFAGPECAAKVDVDELVRSHLPLVGHLVREVLSRVPAHVRRDELVSAGTLALVMSAKSFDPARGTPFAQFARIRIRGALTDELRTMDWASRAVRGRARQVEGARGELAAILGRTPGRSEVAQALGLSLSELDAVETDVHRASVLSLQALTDESDTDFAAEADGPEGLLLRREQLGYLRDAVAELPDRLRTVVEEYFFGQRKMAEIAADLGVTESRVSQMRSEALSLLRAGLQATDLAVQPVRARGQSAVKQAYLAAVAARSTLAGRLAATTLLCESWPAPPLARVN